MKKVLSVILSITIFFSMSVTAFATDASTANSLNTQTRSFIDAEGKVNSVNITIPQIGSSHIEYYIDKVLINTVDVTLSNSGQTRSGSDQLSIKYTDAATNMSQQFTEPLSTYTITSEEVTSPATLASYIYQGQINFKTFVDTYGNSFTDSLDIYQQTGSTTNVYKTINASKGTVASVVIAVIAAALTIFCPALSMVATNLFAAAAYAAGTAIVGGIVQGAITKQYYVRTTSYSVKASDISTSRERIYDAERYQVALSGGGYSSSYYYEGYLPWKTNTVAYWMFCDFWAYSYPGVSSYS